MGLQGGMRIYAPSRMQSVKDLPAETRLKFRCEGGLRCRLGREGPVWPPRQAARPPGGVLAAVPPARPPPDARCRCGLRSLCVRRQPGQNTTEELLLGDLRSKLEEKERKHLLKTQSANFVGALSQACGALRAPAAAACGLLPLDARQQVEARSLACSPAAQPLGAPRLAPCRGARRGPAVTRDSSGASSRRRGRRGAAHAGAQGSGCR